MSAIINENLNGATVEYNGIRFDGGDTNIDGPSGDLIQMTPPEFDLSTEPDYDEARRVVTEHRHTLTVRSLIHSPTEEEQTQQVEVIRRRLLEPGRLIVLTGLGLGFPEQVREGLPQKQPGIADISWGPKPISLSLKPFGGAIAHELVWVVEFRTPPCTGENLSPHQIKAMNYTTTWSNDAEGFTTRTIAGYVEIQQPQGRRTVGLSTGGGRPRVFTGAESLRKSLAFFVPLNFKRLNSDWRESLDRSRMDFVVVDSQLKGSSYPTNIVKAVGKFAETFDPFSFAKAGVSLTMTLTTAAGTHPSVAAARFLAIALDKQRSMQKGKNTQVIPKRMTVEAGLFDDARISSFSIQWMTTGCIADFLFSTPWENLAGTGEVTEKNTSRWAQSMTDAGIWGNRGNSGAHPAEGSDFIIDVCDSGAFDIGRVASSEEFRTGGDPIKGMDCGTINKETSWIDYDVQLKVWRRENVSIHRRAAVNNQSFDASGAFSPAFYSGPQNEHVTESNGLPTQIVILQMKGLRFGHKPEFPVLETFGCQTVQAYGDRQIEEEVVTRIGKCPVHFMRGYQMYIVKGYISGFKPLANPSVCVPEAVASSSGAS